MKRVGLDERVIQNQVSQLTGHNKERKHLCPDKMGAMT